MVEGVSGRRSLIIVLYAPFVTRRRRLGRLKATGGKGGEDAVIARSADGDVRIRLIKIDDVQAFLTLCQTLDRETMLMMLEPGER